MTLAELVVAISLALLTAIGGIFLIDHSVQVSSVQLKLSRFINNEPYVRQVLQKTAGMSQRARVYSTASGATTGTQSLVASSGPVIRVDYAGGVNAGGNASWAAIIEYRSATQRLVYRNINNSTEWVIADRISAASFSIVNGVLVLDATMDTKAFSIYTSVN